jgi:hypothetical protein
MFLNFTIQAQEIARFESIYSWCLQKHAATVVREIVKHTPELAQLVVGNGGVGSLVDYVAESNGNNRLPGIMALGYIAAFSETLALSVVAEKALPPLVQVESVKFY